MNRAGLLGCTPEISQGAKLESNEAVAVSPGDIPPQAVELNKPGQGDPIPKRLFELVLWNSRFIVLVPVFASVCIAAAMFYAATIDTWQNVSDLQSYMVPSPLPFVHDEIRTHLISHIVEAIDGYLLGVVMLIFAMGLYELFVSKISVAQHSDRARGILIVHSLDDLKARLSQVITLMLIVKFFEAALKLPYQTPIELIILAGGIVLIALALLFTHSLES